MTITTEAEWPLADKSMAWGGRRSGTPFVILWSPYTPEINNLLMADKSISVSHMANGQPGWGPAAVDRSSRRPSSCVMRGAAFAVSELPVATLQQHLLLIASPHLVLCPVLSCRGINPAGRKAQ